MKIKHTLSVLFIAALSFILLSFSTTASTGDNIIIKKGFFSVNGTKMNPAWLWPTCKTALGEPDRSYEGYNLVHTYDKKNIVVFEGYQNLKPTGDLKEFQIHFSVPESSNVTPKGSTFTGTLKIDKLVVTKNLTAKTMLAKLKKWEKTDSYSEHNYRMQYKDLYVYFLFTDDETSLIKVSIGPNVAK